MDIANDRLSIKNLLFTKAIPNREIPVPINGHKIYPCTDCGDKFILESSYENHVNRKSMTITYKCRHCGQTKVFFNRCKLLYHIRSHSFKTATINVQDLKVEPLPICLFNIQPNQINEQVNDNTASNQVAMSKTNAASTVCYECKERLPGDGPAYIHRVNHFMQYTNELYSCPVCLFTLPTVCGLRAHLRFHLKFPPYVCPECGVSIINKNMHYPFNHDCEGFNMMRATTRLKCPLPQCNLYHPNDFKDHMKEAHIKKVYKCPICVVACFNEGTMHKHLKEHDKDAKALIFYQCEFCPGRLVLQFHIETHLRTHVNTNVYPCWTCGTVFKEVFALIDHHVKKHNVSEAVKKLLTAIVHESENQVGKPKRIYRVVKRCDQCKRDFSYKCKYNEIPILPNECPYKCTSTLKSNFNTEEEGRPITCQMCKTKISSDWKEIKRHYAQVHKNYKCLEPKLLVKRIDVRKYISENKKKTIRRDRQKRRKMGLKSKAAPQTIATSVSVPNVLSALCCSICKEDFETKPLLEEHMISHRDPCMAYQCMECGQSFVVRPSFSKHLLLEHNISDADEYINSKQCFNENALEENQNNSDVPTEPLKENQCNICRDQFDNDDDLKKHYRVHGMAFLLKNTSNKSP